MSIAPLPALDVPQGSDGDVWMDEDFTQDETRAFRIPLSHAGGELEDLQELQQEIFSLPERRCVALNIYLA